MRQVLIRSGKVVVEEIPSPVVGNKEILVANAFSVISAGTEASAVQDNSESLIKKALKRPDLVISVLLKMRSEGIVNTLKGVQGTLGEPMKMGYSTAGIVIGVGKEVIDISIGDKVTCAGAQSAHHAEVVSVPRNLVTKLPEGVDLKDAAFSTLGAIAMQGIRRAERKFGETIAVIGLGLLGILGAQIAKAEGYRVIGFDLNDMRVEEAKKLGLEAYNPQKDDPLKVIRDLTGGFGADAVVLYIATTSSSPPNLAFDLCRQKGRVVLVGVCGMELDRNKMYRKELDFVISTSYGPGRYDPMYEEQGVDYPIGYIRWTENRNMAEFLRLIAENRINIKELEVKKYAIDEAEQAYGTLKDPERPLALVFGYDYSQYLNGKTIARKIIVNPEVEKGREGIINVGLLGAGGFVKAVHIPNLLSLNDKYKIKAIVTAHGEKAKYLAETYKADYASTDYKEVLKDSEIDLVFVGTRHNLHYPMVMDALEAGKPVFVEKPLCLKEEELENIVRKVEETKIPVIVGFNRRYSPLAVYLKERLNKLKKPCFIQYRVNAGFIPKDHWVHDLNVGGGRIIGEGCHFFDFFNFLVGKEIEVVNVKADDIPVNNSTVIARDNTAAVIRYTDGSVAVLTYIALGSQEIAKERIEVFADGKTFVLNDFRSLEVYGETIVNNNLGGATVEGNKLVLSGQDKGLKQELIELADFLKGEKSNIVTFPEVVRATDISFKVNSCVRKGG